MKFRIFSIKENRYLLPSDYAINSDGEIFELRPRTYEAFTKEFEEQNKPDNSYKRR